VVLLTSLYLDATLRVGGIEEKEEEEIFALHYNKLNKIRIIIST